MVLEEGLSSERRLFDEAIQGCLEVVSQIDDTKWEEPALGDWDLRSLLGHTGRAMSTVEAYLLQFDSGVLPWLKSPSDYFRAAKAGLSDPQAVLDRGKAAGLALGVNPKGAIIELADRGRAAMLGAGPDATVTTPVGKMRLDDYLPTRTFELALHSVDIAAVLNLEIPEVLQQPIYSSLELAIRLLDGLDSTLLVLSAITGRRGIEKGFSIL
jgi:hypothetical protein